MNKSFPDKHVRKAVKLAINNMVVNSNTIKCYDTRVSGSNIPQHYILMSTQTSDENKANKCESRWKSSILIDVVTTYIGSGNIGSRNLSDDIMDKVREKTKSLSLSVSSGLTIVNQTQNFPNDISTITQTENIFRKFMRLEMVIN